MAEETLFRWQQENFLERYGIAQNDEQWNSPKFEVKGVPGAKFLLSFYPKGEDRDDNEDEDDEEPFFGVYLCVYDFGGHSFIRVKYKLWLDIGRPGPRKWESEHKFVAPQDSGWGPSHFVPLRCLQKFAREGPLFVCCSVRPVDPIDAVEWAEKAGATAGRRKIAATFDSGHFTDTEVHVQGKVFKVSRAIICAGSPHFRAMFTNETKEKERGVVEIKKVSADLVELLLRFLYAGEVKGLSEVAARLLPVADYYEVLELSALCMEALLAHVTVQSVLRDLQLVFRHDHEGAFKRKFLAFAHKNLKHVRQQPAWTTAFIRDNAEIADALLGAAHV